MSTRGREGEPTGEERGETSVLDQTLHALHTHIENWGRHADEKAKRDPSLDVQEASFVRALAEADIPDNRREAVLDVVNQMLGLAKETGEGDESAIANLEDLKVRLDLEGKD